MLGVAAVTVGGPFIYIHFISGKAPPPLALATTDPTTAWSIPNPSFGPVSTEDHGVLEFLLTFSRS